MTTDLFAWLAEHPWHVAAAAAAWTLTALGVAVFAGRTGDLGDEADR